MLFKNGLLVCPTPSSLPAETYTEPGTNPRGSPQAGRPLLFMRPAAAGGSRISVHVSPKCHIVQIM